MNHQLQFNAYFGELGLAGFITSILVLTLSLT